MAEDQLQLAVQAAYRAGARDAELQLLLALKYVPVEQIHDVIERLLEARYGGEQGAPVASSETMKE